MPPEGLRLPVRLGHRAVARLSLVEQHEIVEDSQSVTAAIANSSWIDALGWLVLTTARSVPQDFCAAAKPPAPEPGARTSHVCVWRSIGHL